MDSTVTKSSRATSRVSCEQTSKDSGTLPPIPTAVMGDPIHSGFVRYPSLVKPYMKRTPITHTRVYPKV